MGGLLAWYGYQLDKSCFITNANEHMLTHTTIIKTNHSNSQSLLTHTIDNIMTDITIVLKAFD